MRIRELQDRTLYLLDGGYEPSTPGDRRWSSGLLGYLVTGCVVERHRPFNCASKEEVARAVELWRALFSLFYLIVNAAAHRSMRARRDTPAFSRVASESSPREVSSSFPSAAARGFVLVEVNGHPAICGSEAPDSAPGRCCRRCCCGCRCRRRRRGQRRRWRRGQAPPARWRRRLRSHGGCGCQQVQGWRRGPASL